ncbi:Lipid A 3-O-deacylase (PagL) [Aequorivita sublithincola DSM 14238]|uniref:Lipid A 3-O-deacylase (PagL) n=1 Tax=Aequorivita sublithincola (strain DSM 14238 / LMG 21431 / ACAM 643 / 9-3) TaxID=746697 RepID=I3YZ89_AEQSU|nr:acyloxyacyl hydrolase [Aequorivita sublithincola]AFL82307.1 Lipid A 3-O-deacylase (PagL) [Aequorivita sublithincola DSM 14238]
MKKQLTIFFLFVSFLSFAQSEREWKKSALTFTPEILLGKTMEANGGFPETKLQKQLLFNIGRYHTNNPQEWAQRLKGPKTGLTIGVTDFGSLDSLGLGITAMPFIEFQAFGSHRWKVLSGLGASYFTKKYDEISNPRNQAVTTDVTWAFRTYLYYQFLSTKNIDWRAGLGYSHHSNGHTHLLNQGYNSFLVSVSADIKNPLKRAEIVSDGTIPQYKRTVYDYYAIRGGLGQNVFALAFNDRKNVYTIAGEYGRVYNNTFKVGLGFYYRFYQHYYDYIKRNESLVQDEREFDYFKENPWSNATNFGVSLHGEVFLNHVGIDLQVGYNFHKPAYKMEWRINEGWDNTPKDIPDYWMLGELDSSYKKKNRISTRLGIKYYLIGMENAPKNNIYLGANLNSNLGQADFTELSIGYVHRFKKRDR